MESEDFSFPRINDICAHNIDSPPLWNLSPAASPNPYHYCQVNKGEENDCFEEKVIAHGQRKSFSCIEIRRKIIGLEDDDDDDDEDVQEHKMDLLWEDFNEELLLSTTTGSSTTSSSREAVEFRSCAPSLTLAKAKNNNALVPSNKNKPSMVVIVKILKKFFSINNNVQGRQRKRVR